MDEQFARGNLEAHLNVRRGVYPAGQVKPGRFDVADGVSIFLSVTPHAKTTEFAAFNVHSKRAGEFVGGEHDSYALALATATRVVQAQKRTWRDEEMPSPVRLGQTVAVNSFAFTNRHGGTEIANTPAEVTVIRKWWDYETGWRYWALQDGQKVFVDQHVLAAQPSEQPPPKPGPLQAHESLFDQLCEEIENREAETACRQMTRFGEIALEFLTPAERMKVQELCSGRMFPNTLSDEEQRCRDAHTRTEVAYALLTSEQRSALFGRVIGEIDDETVALSP